MVRTRKCKCGHTWNEHDAFATKEGRQLIVCMHFDISSREGGISVGTICECREWNPAEEEV